MNNLVINSAFLEILNADFVNFSVQWLIMSDYYEFINIAISFSILLKVVLLIILSARKFRKKPASYWAFLIILLLGYYFFTLFHRYGWFDNIPVFKAITSLIPLAFGPGLFLLFSHFLNPKQRSVPQMIGYFTLLSFFIIGLIPYLFFISASEDGFISTYSEIYILLANETGAMGFLLVSIWGWIQIRKIRIDFQSGIPTSIKYKGKPYRFVRIMVFLILCHGIIWMLDIHLSIFVSDIGFFFNQANLIYFLIVGYIFIYLFLNYPMVIYETALVSEVPEKEKYQFSNLSKEKAKSYLNRMNTYMLEQKPFLDPDLSLQQLSEQLNIPHTVLSEIMNNIVNQNFYDYVNNFRVEEFKRLIGDKNNRHLKILSLAYDSGFQSKTTFNTAFKKFTGQTPSEYMKTFS